MSAPSENPSPTSQASHTKDPTVAAQDEPVLSTTNDDSDHLAIVKSLLQDPLLKDLPANPTLEEVKTLIAIEEGRAYRIRIERKGLQDIPLVVSQATTVKRIKNLVQIATKRMLRNQGSKRSINWKYIWRTHCLILNGEKLLNENTAVSAMGIKNGTTLQFERHTIRREKRSKDHRNRAMSRQT